MAYKIDHDRFQWTVLDLQDRQRDGHRKDAVDGGLCSQHTYSSAPPAQRKIINEVMNLVRA